MGYVTVHVDLEDFDDEDIREEYEARGLGETDLELKSDNMEELTRIWVADRNGQKEKAYELMREYVLERLNKTI